VQQNVVKALAAIGKPAMLGMIKALSSRHGNVRIFAASGLGRLGPKAKQAIPELEKNLTHKQHYVRVAAEKALKSIRGIKGAALN